MLSPSSGKMAEENRYMRCWILNGHILMLLSPGHIKTFTDKSMAEDKFEAIKQIWKDRDITIIEENGQD